MCPDQKGGSSRPSTTLGISWAWVRVLCGFLGITAASQRGTEAVCGCAGTWWASSVAVILVIKVAPLSSVISVLTVEENDLQ